MYSTPELATIKSIKSGLNLINLIDLIDRLRSESTAVYLVDGLQVFGRDGVTTRFQTYRRNEFERWIIKSPVPEESLAALIKSDRLPAGPVRAFFGGGSGVLTGEAAQGGSRLASLCIRGRGSRAASYYIHYSRTLKDPVSPSKPKILGIQSIKSSYQVDLIVANSIQRDELLPFSSKDDHEMIPSFSSLSAKARHRSSNCIIITGSPQRKPLL
ncbi:uncharacterized protein BDR25DRAFT_356311 [Lindgomyces ingoldianus]|uniref:Uncharacterized protein n=1 Tax=Lindgomyces ingoldianus TaxID=673940 RepID=A0ACB6QRD5_9PLEO|nr:uncharacterized protein BDR25DRAFT_356311 [Lindgomyces ingoldianus]KAF2469579.1 hypothetical protein BDR25DRAFT_356311 [Lindgomyces ingoldianus]